MAHLLIDACPIAAERRSDSPKEFMGRCIVLLGPVLRSDLNCGWSLNEMVRTHTPMQSLLVSFGNRPAPGAECMARL
jgi:hypothetical protein